MAKKEKLPSVLAFEKKLVCSDGYLYATTWEKRKEMAKPLGLNEKSVRGTISNRLNKKLQDDPAKLDAIIESPNPKVVDSCALNLDQDTVKIHFSLKVLGGVGIPSACNNMEFRNNLVSITRDFARRGGFSELGKRYAINIANGRYLWRNRVGAEAVEVVVSIPGTDTTWVFDGFSVPMRNFDCENSDVLALGQKIAETLASEQGYLLLDIDAFAKIGKGQEVYPSEEMILGNKQRDQNGKNKILYQINGQAGMHSQKLGNAIRTIDTWYPEMTGTMGPIAIEPYGAVTSMGHAFRTPTSKSDFYTLFDAFALGKPLSTTEAEQYVMAVLVRGGVFGESSKEK